MKNQSFKEYFERINLIYYALIAPPLVLFAMAYLPNKDRLIPLPDDIISQLLGISGGMLMLLLSIYGRRLFKRSLLKIEEVWTFKRKLEYYKSALILFHWRNLLAGLGAVSLLFFTNYSVFTAVYPILLLIISLSRPTVERLRKDLPLSKKELAIIKNNGQILNNVG